MQSNEFHVIVVGGGPAGSTCAALLSKAGLEVLLIDKAKFPRQKICGDCINPAAWHIFDLLGISDEIKARTPNFIEWIRVHNKNGEIVQVHLKKNITPFFAMCRSELDDILLNHAKKLGVIVLDETRVVDLIYDRKWNIFISGIKNKNNKKVNAKILVGADGRNSFVARKLSKQSQKNKSFNNGKSLDRVGIQWLLNSRGFENNCVDLFFYDLGYFGIVGLGQNLINLAMVTTPGIARLVSKNPLKFLSKTIKSNNPFNQIFGEVSKFENSLTAFPINPRQRQTEFQFSCLIGDARKTVEPFTGQGIYFALQDGVIAAKRILEHFGNKTDTLEFSKINRFWVNHVFSPILRNSGVTNKLISFGSGNLILTKLAAKSVFNKMIL
ncbi:FAD-dependent monooxygenase [candidate division KSB1 bacterium]|nr:FAD-dependent monooxygenase [candidate division KSB1 bacterium]